MRLLRIMINAVNLGLRSRRWIFHQDPMRMDLEETFLETYEEHHASTRGPSVPETAVAGTPSASIAK